MISFSCLESTEAVIFPVTCYRPGTIISQSAGIPCTDPGYPHLFPVCLMFTASLDIPLSPQVQFLLFLSRYLPLHLQILCLFLRDDHVFLVFREIHQTVGPENCLLDTLAITGDHTSDADRSQLYRFPVWKVQRL